MFTWWFSIHLSCRVETFRLCSARWPFWHIVAFLSDKPGIFPEGCRLSWKEGNKFWLAIELRIHVRPQQEVAPTDFVCKVHAIAAICEYLKLKVPRTLWLLEKIGENISYFIFRSKQPKTGSKFQLKPHSISFWIEAKTACWKKGELQNRVPGQKPPRETQYLRP